MPILGYQYFAAGTDEEIHLMDPLVAICLIGTADNQFAIANPDSSELQLDAGYSSLPAAAETAPIAQQMDIPLKFRLVRISEQRAGKSQIIERSRRDIWNKVAIAAFCLIALLGFVARTAPAIAGENKTKLTREFDLKAAFLFNFSQFVEWPPDAFSDTNAPFVIAVLGEDPFGRGLDEIVANEFAHGRRILVKRYRDVKRIASCQILYVSESEPERLNAVFDFLDRKAILAVGETDLFAARGGAVRFLVENNKLRLKINVERTKAARLVMSSKLLRQAEIVGEKPQDYGR